MNNNEFLAATKILGIELTKEQQEQLAKYYQLLTEENKITNLTRIINIEDVYLKHFYDSLTVIKVIDLNKVESLADIGSGAGFPGIVLKTAFPHLHITLIEATNKKVQFLNKVITELKLTNIRAICERVEDHHQQYEVVTARAVAKLNILLELCIPIAKEKGHFVAMKANLNNEINEAENALVLLKSEVVQIEELVLPKDCSKRNLIKIIKNKKTDKKYPRKFNQITKNPL